MTIAESWPTSRQRLNPCAKLTSRLVVLADPTLIRNAPHGTVDVIEKYVNVLAARMYSV
jgi:hypothetical protein